jgi:hypothetical protein
VAPSGPADIQEARCALQSLRPAHRPARTPEQLARLDEASAIPPVFPYTVIDHREYRHRATGGKLDQLDHPSALVA